MTSELPKHPQAITWDEIEVFCGFKPEKPSLTKECYFPKRPKRRGPRSIASSNDGFSISAERSLLVALLDRAIRDLLSEQGYFKTTARNWITSPWYGSSPKRGISFAYCCDHLDISRSKIVQFLQKKGLL